MGRNGAPSLWILGVATAAAVALTTPLLWVPAAGTDFGKLGRLVVTSQPRGDAHEARPRSDSPVTAIPVEGARLRELPPERRGPVPVRVSIGALGVRAPVVPVGVDGGTTEIPVDVGTVGWYRFGAEPGERGSAVFVGHVSSAVQGLGVFASLVEVSAGDRVEVGMSDGTTRAFRVVARRTMPKASLPDEVFRRSGRPLLTLITCGGPFDEATGHYVDNVVVAAVPIAGPGSKDRG